MSGLAFGPVIGRWRTAVYVHVAPVDDTITHEDAETCPCGPTVEEETRPDGSPAWIVVHHSLDGREANETASPTARQETTRDGQ